MNWRDDAACLGRDPELFFPVGTSGPALTRSEEAKKVCAACPVECRCLEWALLANIQDGIWGGLDDAERRALHRQRRRDQTSRHPV